MPKLYHYVRYFASCPLTSRNTWNHYVKCVGLTHAGYIDILAAAGLLDIEETALPGHGRQKYVRATADRICLQAVVA